MTQKIKAFLHKFNKILKEYQSTLVLLLVLGAMGLSIYNTYLIKNAPVPTNPVLGQTAKQLTKEDVQKMIDNGAPVLGDPNAKVTVVEFGDFQCPYCERYFTDVLPTIKEQFIDTGKARFIYISYAFLGDESKDAAMASKCAQDQGKFWEYHDHLYKNQAGENMGAFRLENLKRFAVELKLNTKQFNECMDSKKHAQTVEKEINTARDFGVKSTPSTFVGGIFAGGLRDKSEFVKRIEAAQDYK